MVHTPLGVTSLPQRNVHKVSPCCGDQRCVPFHFRIIDHCQTTPQFIYVFAWGVYIDLEGLLHGYTRFQT